VSFVKIPIGLLLIAFAASAAHAQSRPSNVLRAEIVGLHSDQGQVMCALFPSSAGFPGDISKATGGVSVKIHDGKAVCEFTNVAPGSYAVSVFHDENSNGKLDKKWLVIPAEGVGASNDAKGSMGPPKFDDARFEYKGGPMTLTIHIVYL
jgi:uncharacterized protein (DUF2141 family)